MIKSLTRQLGFDRVGEVLSEEVCGVQVEVLCEERDPLARMLANLDARIVGLGGKRRSRSVRPKDRP